MLIEVIVFLLGVIYGFLKPGKEDRWYLFKKAIKIGVALGIVVGVLSILLLMPFGLVHPLTHSDCRIGHRSNLGSCDLCHTSSLLCNHIHRRNVRR